MQSLFILLIISFVNAECSERKLRKYPIVFKDCEKYYDQCDCLKRKEHYLKESECVDSEEYKEVSAVLQGCGEPKEGSCLYKNDYECRIVHSGCLDGVSLGLGGSKQRCLEKFVECLKKVHCENMPMYQQATEILAHPDQYAEQLKTVVQNRDTEPPKQEEVNDSSKEQPKAEL